MAKAKKTTTDFADVIRHKLENDPLLASAVDEARVEADIAEEIYHARIDARLTQQELADRIGTHESVIARMEDADYQGHSVALLRRIAAATGKRLDISFCARVSSKKPRARKRLPARH